MAQRADSKQSQVTWQSLNKRQRDYLTAIYEVDQEQEAAERARTARFYHSRPAEEWRWMLYATLAFTGDTPVKRRLRTAGLIDPGTGSTFEALESRGYIACRHTGFPEDPLISIQITPAGRKLVRQALSIQLPKRLPTGSLQEWHWRARALTYAARHTDGIKQDGSYYGRIGWNTWLRLRDYKVQGTVRPLVKEHSETRQNESSWSSQTNYSLQITAFGATFYEREWPRYHALYPGALAPPPEHLVDPSEPYVELKQDKRTCLACRGRYPVLVTCIYHLGASRTWSVTEQEERAAGLVTSEYEEEVEQCVCQHADLREVRELFMALLDRLAASGWRIRFPGYHPWYGYLEYGLSQKTEGVAYHDPGLVKQRLLPLLHGDTDIEDNRNIAKGEVLYCYNEEVGKGGVYAVVLGTVNKWVLALTRREAEAS